jgi:hypothetical protein
LGLNEKSPRNILSSKIQHENEDIFRNGLNNTGVENVWLSNNSNKSVSNFHETIPLNEQIKHISSEYFTVTFIYDTVI